MGSWNAHCPPNFCQMHRVLFGNFQIGYRIRFLLKCCLTDVAGSDDSTFAYLIEDAQA